MAGSNSSGDGAGEAIAGLFAVVLMVVAVLAGLALFISVGAIYGSWVGFVNYWRALMNNVALERPQP